MQEENDKKKQQMQDATEGQETQVSSDDANQSSDVSSDSDKDQTDWKAEARKWQKRAQDNFKKAQALDSVQSNLEQAQQDASAYKKQFEDLSAQQAQNQLKSQISKETGVPSDLIVGDDEDSMRAFAQAVAEFAKKPSAPTTPKAGSFANDAGSSADAAKRKLAQMMFNN